MKTISLIFLSLMAGYVLTACQAKSNSIEGHRVVPPAPKTVIPSDVKVTPDQITWITLDGGNSQFEFNPQVDILFVVDNSASMASAQQNLSSNINQFVDGFQTNKVIDYHVGVISVWDSSERFLKTKKDPYQKGELRRLRDGQGNQTRDARFVYRFENSPQVLAATLNLGTVSLEDGGPENEEIFSPLSAALKLAAAGQPNQGFFRDKAQLVIVIVTDADDKSAQISASQLARELIDFKGGDAKKVAVYGALVKKSDPEEAKDYVLRVHPKYHPECFSEVIDKDTRGRSVTTQKRNSNCAEGFGPEMIDELIIHANASSGTSEQIREKFIMSLIQKDFGKDLARIGSDITAKTLAKDIVLPEPPRRYGSQDQRLRGQIMVRVFYGTPAQVKAGTAQEIPNQAKGGWLYDPSTLRIQLAGDIRYRYSPDASFVVKMVPARQP